MLLHFPAYLRAGDHETRATSGTLGSLILIFTAGWTLVAVLAQ